MRILISNDDGLKFPGLLRLRERLEAFGETWVFAPAEEKSATSMALSIHTDVPVVARRRLQPAVPGFRPLQDGQ